MNDSGHVQELSAAYALGALAPEEARDVERHCVDCRTCAADLAEMTGIAATLPLACDAASPSNALKRQILGHARGDVAADRLLRRPARRVAPIGPTWWAAAAAAVFISGAALGTAALYEHRKMAEELTQSQDQLSVAHAQEATLRAQAGESQHVLAALAAGRVWDVSGGPPRHYWHCTIVQPPKPEMAMLLASTPAAPRGMTYQAWIIRHGKAHNAGMVPAGKMSMMNMPMPVEAGDVVAFTVERDGGSSNPTMPYVMEQTLD